MVYLLAREKFHGQMLPGAFYRKYASAQAARQDTARWNSLTLNDQIYPIAVFDELPADAVKTKYPGIYRAPNSALHGRSVPESLAKVNRAFR